MALYSRSVFFSLLGGIVLGLFILHDYALVATFQGLFELFISLLSEAWILKTLGFAILVGSVMALMEVSGGIEAFVSMAQSKRYLRESQKAALLIPYAIGIFIFIESSITSLIAGAVGKPLCDAHKIPHAKLAYVCDATAAPISSLIVLNGWGALLLGLITSQIELGTISGESIDILLHSVAYNFYAMSALVVTFVFIWFNIDIGYMKTSPFIASTKSSITKSKSSIYFMILPIFFMVLTVFFFLYWTGDGDILNGSGSSSIFYTMIATLIMMFILYVGSQEMSPKLYFITLFKGAKKLFGIAMILLLAFGIGKITTQMHTGLYLASLASENLNIYLLSATIFVLSAIISFSTGTSWGTFSIMIPVAVPMSVGMDAEVAMGIGAVISGGVFGDHCSPISDTTIISSMASDCEVIEHVKTQLPYALISAGLALVFFILFSFLS